MDQERQTSRNRPLLITALVLVFCAAAFAGIFRQFYERPTGGDKRIALEVIYEDGTVECFDIQTDAAYLKEAVEKTVLIDGGEGEYGYMLFAVNDVIADWTNHTYWAIYVNGEYGSYPLDQQPVNDGDSYQLIYEKF